MMKTEEREAVCREAAEMERYVEDAREATEAAYDLLRRGAPAAAGLAGALPKRLESLYRSGHGGDADEFVEELMQALCPDGCTDSEAFREGVRLGFAAGCLVQWRVQEYLVGEELPLWPVQRYSTDRQVD